MKKFEFSLKVLLDVRQREEKTTKSELNNAQAILNEAQRALANMEEQKNEGNISLVNASKKGIKATDLQSYYFYIDTLRNGIERQKKNIASAEMRCENLRSKLVNIKKEIKMLEILKDQKYKEYLQEVAAEDLKMIDDFLNSRQKST